MSLNIWSKPIVKWIINVNMRSFRNLHHVFLINRVNFELVLYPVAIRVFHDVLSTFRSTVYGYSHRKLISHWIIYHKVWFDSDTLTSVVWVIFWIWWRLNGWGLSLWRWLFEGLYIILRLLDLARVVTRDFVVLLSGEMICLLHENLVTWRASSETQCHSWLRSQALGSLICHICWSLS